MSIGAPIPNPPLPVSAGNVFSLFFPLLNPDGTPATYTAPVAYFSLAATSYPVEGSTPALSKNSLPLGGVRIFQTMIKSVNTWVVYVDFVETDTENQPPGSHYYQLRIVDGSDVGTVATGNLVILATITRE